MIAQLQMQPGDFFVLIIILTLECRDGLLENICKMLPACHHQDSVRRVVASGDVIWGGEKNWASELLHDGSTVYATGFESSLSFLHRARQFFSFSKRERKEWGRKSDGQGRFRCSRKSQTVLFDRTGP